MEVCRSRRPERVVWRDERGRERQRTKGGKYTFEHTSKYAVNSPVAISGLIYILTELSRRERDDHWLFLEIELFELLTASFRFNPSVPALIPKPGPRAPGVANHNGGLRVGLQKNLEQN